MTTAGRQVVPFDERFFNDGAFYVLTSTSLGGSGLTPGEISGKLVSRQEEEIRDLMTRGVCLPIYFPGDCALDQSAVVIGELTEREQAEWLGRIRLRIDIPCGEFLVMGGALEEDFDVALQSFEAPDPHFVYFQKFRLDPGAWLVEVYAFLGSMTVNFAWEDPSAHPEPIPEWWQRTRPGEPHPEWLESLREEDYVDGEAHGLLEYIVRLTPADESVPVPPQEEDMKWCWKFDMRRPDPCPRGLPRAEYRSAESD
jgi:hypothetical protein